MHSGERTTVQFIVIIVRSHAHPHYCPVVEKAKVPNTPVVIDDYRSLDLLTI